MSNLDLKKYKNIDSVINKLCEVDKNIRLRIVGENDRLVVTEDNKNGNFILKANTPKAVVEIYKQLATLDPAGNIHPKVKLSCGNKMKKFTNLLLQHVGTTTIDQVLEKKDVNPESVDALIGTFNEMKRLDICHGKLDSPQSIVRGDDGQFRFVLWDNAEIAKKKVIDCDKDYDDIKKWIRSLAEKAGMNKVEYESAIRHLVSEATPIAQEPEPEPETKIVVEEVVVEEEEEEKPQKKIEYPKEESMDLKIKEFQDELDEEDELPKENRFVIE